MALALLVAFVAALAARPCACVKVQVQPGRTECVSQTVSADHFAIEGGPRIDGRVLVSGSSQYYAPFVTVRVIDPKGDQIWQQQHVYSETHFNVGAHGPGSYRVCFYNPWESRTDAMVDMVYFTLAHLRRKGGVVVPKGTEEARSKEVAHKDHMDEVRRTILGMAEFIEVVSGSHKYLQRKLDRHKRTLESNRSRTLTYTALECGALVAIAVVQVVTIRSLFMNRQVKISV